MPPTAVASAQLARFDFLTGGGEMGARMRAHDWSASPLGLPATWPATLKSMIRLMQTSSSPMLIFWGPELIQFYNDAMIPAMGSERHACALGQSAAVCWREAWHIVGPEIEQVMLGRGGVWHQERLVPIMRNGKEEDVWWSYSYSPIEDEQCVRGVMVICQEITLQHHARERLQQSHQALVESMDEGFCVLEMLFDPANEPVDYRLVEINPAYEKQSGLYDVLGKTVSELLPDIERKWVQIYGQVAKTGEPVRFVDEVLSLGRWFDVYAFRIGQQGSSRVGVLFKDISSQRRLEFERQRFVALADSSTDFIGMADQHLQPFFLNRSGLALVGLESLAQAIKTPVAEFFFPEDRPFILNEFFPKVIREGSAEVEIRFRHFKTGAPIWMIYSVYPVLDDYGKSVAYATVSRNITERRQAEEKIRHAALHDSLTGLPNRDMLFDHAGHLLAQNRRTGQLAAVLFIDLDRFKPINDSHGHGTGDAVLRAIAARLTIALRSQDIVIRLGGDEFIVLLQDIKDVPCVAEVTRQIMTSISQPIPVGGLQLSLSASVGVAMFPTDGDDIDTLISHADKAMYQAKHHGRNDFTFYCPKFAQEARMLLAIEEKLKLALKNRAFHLLYQPVLQIDTGEIVSVEALLRWQDSAIGPDKFIPVAEATGLINPIGRWVIQEAARQHKTWCLHGLQAIPIAINSSVVEFRDPDFVGRFQRAIADHGIGAMALQLEITETAVMDNLSHAIAVLSQLQALGVKILLDDFGAGYSSLAYLARLPLDKIKIDRSFVLALEEDLPSRAVTDAMIALGRTLRLEVLAEGVESEGVMRYIHAHGCSQAQGFYIGKPMSGAAFEAWYRDTRGGHPNLHP